MSSRRASGTLFIGRIKKSRGKLAVAMVSGAGIAVILASLAVLRDSLYERWLIRELGSGESAAQLADIERLGERRSLKAIPYLAELAKRQFVEASETGIASWEALKRIAIRNALTFHCVLEALDCQSIHVESRAKERFKMML